MSSVEPRLPSYSRTVNRELAASAGSPAPHSLGSSSCSGLISSKTPVLESQHELRRRIDEAARYVPLENLALSPQCGFASTSARNVLTPDEQKAKLALIVDTADTVWG